VPLKLLNISRDNLYFDPYVCSEKKIPLCSIFGQFPRVFLLGSYKMFLVLGHKGIMH